MGEGRFFRIFPKRKRGSMRKNQDLTMASTEVRGEPFGRSLGLMMGKKRCPYNVPWTYNTGQEAQEMKDIQRELEEAKADVDRWMDRVRTATTAREMMELLRELTESQLHLEALEWMLDEEEEDGL